MEGKSLIEGRGHLSKEFIKVNMIRCFLYMKGKNKMQRTNIKKLFSLVTFGLCWMAIEGMQNSVRAKPTCEKMMDDCGLLRCDQLKHRTLIDFCNNRPAATQCLDTCKALMEGRTTYCTGPCVPLAPPKK